MERVSIEKIRLDGGTQPRATLNMFVIDEYAQAMRDGAVFPPVVLFYDGTDYWLADGFHRVRAADQMGADGIQADVRQGTRRDAILSSVGANASHGMRRTNEDKRRAVMVLLEDSEWSKWSDSKIAQRCAVTQPFVLKLRGESSYNDYKMERTVQRGTSTYTMKVSNIGERITPEVRDLIRHTDIIDKPRDLFTLSTFEPPKQERIAEKIVTGEAKSVIDARRLVMREDAKNADLPDGRYRVIYCDPPWDYGNDMHKAGDKWITPEEHYPTMTIPELCSLPVKGIAGDSAVLFLWVTSPLLEDAFKVLIAWGFEYKAAFVWDKVKHNFGYYNSVRHELLLICTRGSCLPECKELHDSVVELERSSVHSEKPAYFRELIDKMYPSGSRIELFARGGGAPGWEVWGNEAMSVSSITALSRNLATSAPMSV